MRVTNAKLDDVIELLTDYHANGSYEKLKDNVELLHDENYAVMIRTTNFSQNDFNNNLNYITESAYNYLKKSKVFPNDIIMNKIADAGACYFMPDLGKPVSLGMNLFLICINPKLADSYYIYSYLKYHEHYVKSFASGSATKTITKNDVRKLKILTPPLPEQQKIAKILTTWDKAISTTERLIENSTQQKKALMQQLLTGKKRLLDDEGKMFEGGWKKVKLGELFNFSTASSKSKFIDNFGQNYILDMGSVTRDGKLKPTKKTLIDKDFLSKGQLIMPKDDIGGGQIIGRVGYVDENCKYILSDHVYCLTSKEGCSLFLSYLINSYPINKQIRRQANGTAQLGLGKKDAEKQTVTVPLELEEQQKIATVLTNADTEIELLEQQLADLQQEKKALMQVLLTGKKRVVVDGED